MITYDFRSEQIIINDAMVTRITIFFLSLIGNDRITWNHFSSHSHDHPLNTLQSWTIVFSMKCISSYDELRQYRILNQAITI
jgi:hypothetical protein